MSTHVPETCNESDGLWLPLIEYSVKSGVSLSTIRRKIKNNSIQFRLEKGRYLILFNDVNNRVARQPLPQISPDTGRYLEPESPRRAPQAVHAPTAPQAPVAARTVAPADEDQWSAPWVEKSVRMVSDAYEHALQEKEQRIRLLETRNRELEDRLNELRLLVRVLEEKYEVRY